MAIEIDYFAWEKWRQPKDFWGSLVHKNAEMFGIDTYIQNAVPVASIQYMRGYLVPACYFLLAEDDVSPITKLVCFSWFYRKESHYYLDEMDIDANTAQEFHQDFAVLPSPKHASIEYFPATRDFYSYHIDVGERFGEKSYVWGFDFSQFSLDDAEARQTFNDSIDRIIARCQSLMSHRLVDAETIYEAIASYERAFHSNTKPVTSPRSKLKHKVLYNDKKLLENFRKSNMRLEDNIIGFKHFLSRFLKFMLDDYRGKFEPEHEAIIFTKLIETKFHNWEEREQAAISSYFLALTKYSLSFYPSITISVASLMFWLIKLGIELKPHLAYWESTFIHVDSLRHLGAFLEKLIEENLTDALPETLPQWLNQASLEKALEDAIAAYEGQRPYAHEFVEALENLRLIRA